MNFSPFGNSSFAGSVPGISQFTTTDALVSTVTAESVAKVVKSATNQEQQQNVNAAPNNRYQQEQQVQQQPTQQDDRRTTVNLAGLTHFNQPIIPLTAATTTTISGKFRSTNDTFHNNDGFTSGVAATASTVIIPTSATCAKFNDELVANTAMMSNSQQQQDQQQRQQQSYPPSSTYSTHHTEHKRLAAASPAYPQTSNTASVILPAVAVGTIDQMTATITSAQQQNPPQIQLLPQIQTQQQQITAPQDLAQDLCNAILQQQVLQNTPWQPLTPGTTVADYLSHLPANTLPLSLHNFLKYSAETIKKENPNVVLHVQTSGSPSTDLNALSTATIAIPHKPQLPIIDVTEQHQQQTEVAMATAEFAAAVKGSTTTVAKAKRKRKKRARERRPRPRPGEIRLTTALDGSTLFMCPECLVAYPESDLLEIHLIGHNLERRYICDICQAALKRKDHLARHKQSHNSERPFICTICLKSFKRKEQLGLHFVIHSGEKRYLCQECGKGFYRKDHLRKHTRSHIARHVKAELSLQTMSQPVTETILATATFTAVEQQISQLQQQHESPQ